MLRPVRRPQPPGLRHRQGQQGSQKVGHRALRHHRHNTKQVNIFKLQIWVKILRIFKTVVYVPLAWAHYNHLAEMTVSMEIGNELSLGEQCWQQLNNRFLCFSASDIFVKKPFYLV